MPSGARTSWPRSGTRTGSARRRRSTCTSRGCAARSATTRATRSASSPSVASASASRPEMRPRLIVSTGLIAVAAVLILGIPLGIVEARHTRTEATGRLEREADAVAAAVDDRVEAHRPIVPARIAPYLRSGHRAVVVTPDGTRTVAGPPIHGEVLTQRSGAAQRAQITVSEPREEVDHKVLGVWLLIAA